MIIKVPEDGAPYLVCEECGAVVLLPKRVPIVQVWREHARVCPEGCPAPPATATHLKLTRIASG